MGHLFLELYSVFDKDSIKLEMFSICVGWISRSCPFLFSFNSYEFCFVLSLLANLLISISIGLNSSTNKKIWTRSKTIVWIQIKREVAKHKKMNFSNFFSPNLHLNAAPGNPFATDEQFYVENVMHSIRFSAFIFIKHTRSHKMVMLLRVYVSLTLHSSMPNQFTCDAHDGSVCRMPQWAKKFNRNGIAISVYE